MEFSWCKKEIYLPWILFRKLVIVNSFSAPFGWYIDLLKTKWASCQLYKQGYLSQGLGSHLFEHQGSKDPFLSSSMGVCFHFSCAQLFAAPWTAALQASLSVGFSRQEYWSGCQAPLQGIFRTQGSNPCLCHLPVLTDGFFLSLVPPDAWLQIVS